MNPAVLFLVTIWALVLAGAVLLVLRLIYARRKAARGNGWYVVMRKRGWVVRLGAPRVGVPKYGPLCWAEAVMKSAELNRGPVLMRRPTPW